MRHSIIKFDLIPFVWAKKSFKARRALMGFMEPKSLLPIARHAKELLEHASEHLLGNVERDLIFALIHADNSVEIMLREYLRFDKNERWRDLENRNFHQLLDACTELETVGNNRSQFVAFHDIRNALYHTGTFAPRRQDVESAVFFSKSLFNELHSDQPFREMKAVKPSKRTIKRLTKEFGKQKPYAKEANLVDRLTLSLEKRGYETRPNPRFAGTSIMADLLATKNDEVLVIEVKGKTGTILNSSIFRLAGFVEAARRALPGKKVMGWLVAESGFTKPARSAAAKVNIKLSTSKELDESRTYTFRKDETDEATSKITRDGAEKAAARFVRGKNKNAFEVRIDRAHKENREWVVEGSYATSIEGFPWAFDFEVRIRENGEVASYDFLKRN